MKTGNKKLDELRDRVEATLSGVIHVSSDELDEILPLKANKEPVSEVPCSDGLGAELSLMLDVFNSCIETKTLPKTGSPCQEKIIALLKRCGKEPTALKVRGA